MYRKTTGIFADHHVIRSLLTFHAKDRADDPNEVSLGATTTSARLDRSYMISDIGVRAAEQTRVHLRFPEAKLANSKRLHLHCRPFRTEAFRLRDTTKTSLGTALHRSVRNMEQGCVIALAGRRRVLAQKP